MLALDGAEAQAAALEPELHKLVAPRATAVASALLAHTGAGAPVVRAYLTALAGAGGGAAPAADSIAKYCATASRGRRALVGIFVATWRRAHDMHAVDAAYKNLGSDALDDPDLLAAGVDAARRLGRQAVAAERARRLEIAQRLATLVGKLANDGDQGALEKLPLDELRHVYRRVISMPGKFAEPLVVKAIVALVEDPSVADVSLSAAIAELGAKADVVAVWRERVATGDDALITRLQALFEWTALSASDPAQLAPYIQALGPAARRPEVFAQIDSALASDNTVVRAAALDGWLRTAEIAAKFDDAQIGMLMRSAIAIAEAGTDTVDSRAAHAVLAACAAHPGAAPIAIEVLRAPRGTRAKELRGSLYTGLGRVSHASILPFLVEQLFREREAYPELLDALAAKLDGDVHRNILALLESRARDPDVLRAATLYTELVVEHTSSPHHLISLARLAADWQPATTDDARRMRYITERAVVAALGIHDRDAATKLLARARELPHRPYSEYRVVGRTQDTPSPLADPAVQAQVAELDRAIPAPPTAVPAPPPAAPAAPDATTLSELVGVAVGTRILDDTKARTVWFELAMPLTDIAGFLDGKSTVDERVTLLDASTQRLREVIRIGDRMLFFDGPIDGPPRVFGCRLPSKAIKRTDSWKQVTRSYRSAQGGDATVTVRGATIESTLGAGFPPLATKHASPHAAIEAFQAWEMKLFAAGGTLVAINVTPAG